MTERPTAAENGERTSSDVAAPPQPQTARTADAERPASTPPAAETTGGSIDGISGGPAGAGSAAEPPGPEHAAPQQTAPEHAGGRLYAERLYVPWFHWILPLVAAALLSAELHMGFPVIPIWLPYLVFLPVAVAGLIRLGGVRVQVLDGELWAADAHLPVHFIGTAEVVTAERKRKTLGPELDPTAFVVHRGWVSTMIRIEVTDPADPTPYWLVSTRRPGRLIEALQTAAG